MPVNTLRRRALLKLIPEGVPVTKAMLREKGLSLHAIDNLVKSHALAVLVPGVYTRPEATLSWQGVVCGLQWGLNLDLTVGGLTALELQGMGHYLPLGPKKTVNLYGSDKLPAWANKLLPKVEFQWHGVADLLGRGKKPASATLKEHSVEFSWWEGAPLFRISSPERALLEVLMDVPNAIPFEHADQLMQGMTALSPKRLQDLLERCQNVKIRRLFFWLAERHNYPWLSKLDRSKIPLGSGKRMLAEGGKLDHKYQITVPEDMWTETASTSSKSSF